MFLPASIQIGGISVRNAACAAAVSIGPTMMIGRGVSAKRSQGHGHQTADGSLRFGTIQFVLDNDGVDSLSLRVDGGLSPKGGADG